MKMMINTKENGFKVNVMDMEYKHGRMVIFTKVHGKKIKHMV
jgi:hypothetical protein